MAAPVLATPWKYSVPPLAVTPDFKVVVPDVDTTSVLPPLPGVLKAEFISHDSFRNFYKYGFRPCHSLDDVQYRKIMAIMSALKVAIDSDSPGRMRMIANMLDVFFYELTYYRGEDDSVEISGQGVLFQRFYDLLVENYSGHHDVTWYADRLSLTPKGFFYCNPQDHRPECRRLDSECPVTQGKIVDEKPA